MTAPPPFLLDTCVLVALLRQKELGQRIEHAYNLTANLGKALISVVTVGEMHSLARKWKWPLGKVEKMQTLLEEVVWVDINTPAIFDAYGEIDHFLAKSARPIGQNDIWIAATCRASGAILLTTDRDFDVLDSQFLRRIYIKHKSSK